MPPATRSQCQNKACQYETLENLTMIDQVLKDMELHRDLVHLIPAMANTGGSDLIWTTIPKSKRKHL